MNNCNTCKKDFQPLPGKEWAKECFDCWKAKKNEASGAVAGTTAAAPIKPVANKFNDPERERRIVRQSSLQRAVDLCIGGKIQFDDITHWADGFENWVMREVK